MNVEQLPGNEPIQRMWVQKSGDALAFPGNTFIDPSLAFATFLPDNLRNPANLVDPEVTELWEESLTIEDPEERAEVLRAASRRLTEHPLSVVPLYSNTGSWVMTDDVVGFTVPPLNLYSFRDVGLLAG
jgi:ABC-type transport system substrate-binding protein